MKYLGDGVYVSIENGMLKLFCAAPSEPDTIFLEPEIMDRLVEFYESALKNINSIEEIQSNGDEA